MCWNLSIVLKSTVFIIWTEEQLAHFRIRKTIKEGQLSKWEKEDVSNSNLYEFVIQILKKMFVSVDYFTGMVNVIKCLFNSTVNYPWNQKHVMLVSGLLLSEASALATANIKSQNHLQTELPRCILHSPIKGVLLYRKNIYNSLGRWRGRLDWHCSTC